MVGKTTTPEFAYSGFTESPLWGITRNPWNPDRSAPAAPRAAPGVAVATGCVPLAEGSDMGGSVRIPATFCGVVGLKPSFGRIPFTILPSEFDQLSHFGPLARTIADACLFLQVTQGPDERDIQSLTVPQNFLTPFDTDLRDLSLGLCLDFGERVWHPEVEAAVRSGRQGPGGSRRPRRRGQPALGRRARRSLAQALGGLSRHLLRPHAEDLSRQDGSEARRLSR